MGETRFFGIRHHGPGSARRLVEALAELKPTLVLIEGPADLSEVLPALAHPAMVPPVALLAYAQDAPERAIFWPFAEFSPEYQAIRWALAHGADVQFIDLPAAAKLVAPPEEPDAVVEDPDALDASDDLTEDLAVDPAAPPPEMTVAMDPIGALARAAGYEDGESWWSDVIEENPDPGEVFDAVAAAMAALREDHISDAEEALREAHMRRSIARLSKDTDGPVAVVCGAWHVPALTAKVKASDDNALLKGMAKTRVKATWAPWTSARLARATGYGAGVAAPGWYKHLWTNGSGTRADALWVSRIARTMRDDGDVVSTASVIETVRLTRALAALRGRPSPGFEEMRDAAISALMTGETLPWKLVEARLLLGNEVGTIPDDLPLTPLLDDLQRQQKRLRLKPEALERELGIDLRSDNGQDRSTLLHRLTALDVPWGRLIDPGKSRGTFREKWLLAWDPEFAVRLVENLVYGSTIAAAAAGRMTEAIAAETQLASLAEHVRTALTAQLPEVAATGITRLDLLATETDDCTTLIAAIPPIVDTLRYGTARDMALDQMEGLKDRLIVQGGIALPYAARNLDKDAAQDMHEVLSRANQAIAIAEPAPDIVQSWTDALLETGLADPSSPMVAGLCARLAYEAQAVDIDGVAALLSRRLSRACPAADAASFFEGFFTGAGMKLVHDADLRKAVDAWMLSLDEDDFVENLPLFRRVFSTLDSHERRILLEHLLGRASSTQAGLRLADNADALWAEQMATITAIFDGDRS